MYVYICVYIYIYISLTLSGKLMTPSTVLDTLFTEFSMLSSGPE